MGVTTIAKYTATIYDLIKSGLIENGFNEFYNNNQLTFFDDDYSFMKKIFKYDADVHEVVTTLLFGGHSMNDTFCDERFKRIFINRFMRREIMFQTVETFASEVLAIYLMNEDYIEEVILNAVKYSSGDITTEHTGKVKTKGDNEQKIDSTDKSNTQLDNRSAFQDIPQDNINTDLDNPIVTYASNSDAQRSRQKVEDEKNSKVIGKNTSETDNDWTERTNKYDLASLKEIKNLLRDVLTEFDRNCFLQIG